MNNAVLLELALTWELQAETKGDGLNKLAPPACETLRACADTLRMLAFALPDAAPQPLEPTNGETPPRITPDLREALRKDVMAEFDARMPITSKRFHEWRDWPGTWAFADAAVSVLVGHPKLAFLKEVQP